MEREDSEEGSIKGFYNKENNLEENMPSDSIQNENKNENKETELFAMPDNNTINKVIYGTHFIGFCKQSVKGSIMAIFRFYSDEGTFKNKSKEQVRDILRDGNFVFQNNIQYLNACWHNYFNKSDEYVVEKFNLMMKHGIFLHESCLFTQIWEFSEMLLFYILARLDIDELKDTEFVSQCIDIIMDAILSFHVDGILSRENYCDVYCNMFKYKKGEDFINMKRKLIN